MPSRWFGVAAFSKPIIQNMESKAKYSHLLISEGGAIVQKTSFVLTLEDCIKSIKSSADEDAVRLARLVYFHENKGKDLVNVFDRDDFSVLIEHAQSVLKKSSTQYIVMLSAFSRLGYDVDETFCEEIVLAFLGFEILPITK